MTSMDQNRKKTKLTVVHKSKKDKKVEMLNMTKEIQKELTELERLIESSNQSTSEKNQDE